MSRKLNLYIVSISCVVLSSIYSQEADPIEAARQAKLAAEKAAAEAEAATGAAIEAAAAKAAQAAREKVIADRKAEEERKRLEKEAAEAAEVDAAAEAAALEARRKLAAELGLELEEVPDSSIAAEVAEKSTDLESDSVSVKSNPLNGFNLGGATSVGLLAGETFTNYPTGATLVLTTPYGFNVGPLKYTISLAAGGYTGKQVAQDGQSEDNSFNPSFIGIGGNLTLAELVFAEGHVGSLGEGFGFRGFAGVSLERLMKRGFNLPFNILVGSELFFGPDAAGENNSTGWISFGARLDYGF